jgi:hypothetical protein
MRKFIGSLAALLILAVPASAQSHVITFSEFASPNVFEYEATIGYPLSTGGLDFYQEFDAGARNVLGTWGYADETAVNRPVNIGNSTTLFPTQQGNQVDIYAAGSDPLLDYPFLTPFALYSLDVAHTYASPFALSPINFRLFGFSTTGAAFFQDFLIPTPPLLGDGTRRPVLQTLTLDSRFRSATRVAFVNGSNSVAVQFTNLAVTTVPEPGSFALMATGLLGVMGVAVRRRRRR